MTRGNLTAVCLPRAWQLAIVLPMIFAGCFETRGSAWMKEPLSPDESIGDAPTPDREETAYRRDTRAQTLGSPRKPSTRSTAPSNATSPVAGRSLGVFHNTYYSFPDASEYSGPTATVFDAACKPIAEVPRTFHDKLCVQGSGRLANGRTVSFAKRDCSCASECPRSGQKICYEALDPARFPWGRGALGTPITPFRTVAVDSKVIPLGTVLFIPAFNSVPMPNGALHDGCFRAEDRGLKVVGNRVDVYTGGEAATHDWNQRVNTAQGVEIFVGHPRCESTLGGSKP